MIEPTIKQILDWFENHSNCTFKHVARNQRITFFATCVGDCDYKNDDAINFPSSLLKDKKSTLNKFLLLLKNNNYKYPFKATTKE